MKTPRWLYDPDRVPKRADIWLSLSFALIGGIGAVACLVMDAPPYLLVAAIGGAANGLLGTVRLARAGAWSGRYRDTSNRTAQPATLTRWRN